MNIERVISFPGFRCEEIELQRYNSLQQETYNIYHENEYLFSILDKNTYDIFPIIELLDDRGNWKMIHKSITGLLDPRHFKSLVSRVRKLLPQTIVFAMNISDQTYSADYVFIKTNQHWFMIRYNSIDDIYTLYLLQDFYHSFIMAQASYEDIWPCEIINIEAMISVLILGNGNRRRSFYSKHETAVRKTS